MATAAQIDANRANALKSTGPRTPEGKAASKMNALKHGMDAASILIPGEDPAEYERMVSSYQRDIAPQSALEQFHVDTMTRCDWQRRRLMRTEANLYRALLAEGQTPKELDVNVLRDSPTGKLLLKIMAQIASLERAHSRALAELRRLAIEREQAAMARFERMMDAPLPFLPTTAAPGEQPFLGNEPKPGSQPAPDLLESNLALRL